MRQPLRLANVLPFRGRKQCRRNCVCIAAEITISDTEKTDARTCRAVQVALSA